MIAPPKLPKPDELEALIKEARARQLRRRLLGAAGVAIAAALGLGIDALVTGGPTQDVASRGRPQAITAPCSAAAGWRLRLDELWSEPTGQHTAPLEVTRLGARSCTLHGYPKVVLLSAPGHILPFRYSHRGDSVVAARRPRIVHVRGGGTAFFLLNKYRCDYRAFGAARWLRVSLPGVHGSLTLHWPRNPILDYCPSDPPSRTVAVSPVVASLPQAVAKFR